MIGVALVGFITILAASTKDSIAAAVDESFRADYVVESGSFTQGFATTIEDDLRAVPGVDLLSPLRSAPAEVDGSTTDVMAVDTAVIDELYDLEVTRGSIAVGARRRRRRHGRQGRRATDCRSATRCRSGSPTARPCR